MSEEFSEEDTEEAIKKLGSGVNQHILFFGPEQSIADERAPRSELDLTEAILRNPNAFGSAKINKALKYLEPYFKRQIRGPVQLRETFYEEDVDTHYDIYHINFFRSAYDLRVLIDGWMNFKGIAVKDGAKVDAVLVKSLESRISKFSSPLIAVHAETSAIFEENIFQDYTVRLGQRYNYYFEIRDIGRFSSDNLFFCINEQVCEKPKFVQIHHDIPFQFTANAYKNEKKDHTYTCEVRNCGKTVSFSNQGPDTLPLFLHHKS